MPQVGILSSAQLQTHDHYDYTSGGPILTITRANSANVKITNAAVRTSTAGDLVDRMWKRTLIKQATAGAMRINYTAELDPAAGGDSCHVQAHIYRAGAAIWNGTNNVVAGGGAVIYTDNNIVLDLLAGDAVEIWGHIVVGGGEQILFSQLELCFDAGITLLSRHALTVPLALSVAGIQYENVF
jgi:hypothetical protein